VYDLQEPFRWLADVTVMEAFESGVLDLPDFYFTGDDYRYRFEIEARRRFIGFLRERFNAGVRYGDRVLKWDTVIEQKVMELGRFLAGKHNQFDLLEPHPRLGRADSRDFPKRILSLSHSEARALGIGNSTLHYLRKRARGSGRFTAYSNVRKSLLSTSRS
jgi:CRISPR-associated protein Cas1